MDELTLNAKLTPILQEYTMAISNIKNVMEAIGDAASEAEYHFNQDHVQHLPKYAGPRGRKMATQCQQALEAWLYELIDMDSDLTSQQSAIEYIKYHYAVLVEEKQRQGEAVPKITDVFEQEYKSKKAIWERGRENALSEHPGYHQFKKKIWEATHSTPYQPHHQQQEEDDEEDIQMTSQVETFTCPITKRMMEQPLTSKLCHHSYSKHIVQYIKEAGGASVECPVTGCSKYVRLSDLVPDKALQRRIQRHLAQQASMATQDTHTDAAIVEEEEDE